VSPRILIFALLLLCASFAVSQTVLSPMPRQCFNDSLAGGPLFGGQPLAGGKIFTYQAGTSTPQATFTDSGGLTPNQNPIILDGAGCSTIWLTSGSTYRFLAQNSNGVQEWVTDQVSGSSSSALTPITLANNTSACSAYGVPTFGGCNGIISLPLLYNVADVGAQTTIPVPFPSYVSTKPIKSYLYAGATTRIIDEVQRWFCNTASPCNGHKNIGVQSNDPFYTLGQAQWMKTTGVDVIAYDYYGCGASCGQTSVKAYNLSATKALVSDIVANPTTTPKLMIMIDGGAISGTGTGQCPAAGGDQSVCLIAALNLQNDYLCQNWLYQSYYETNITNGHPIVLYFIDTSSWPGTTFSAVYSAVLAHATAGNTCGGGFNYTATVDFVNENAGGFTGAGLAGGYAWVQPFAYSITQQFCWTNSGGCAFDYLADFYSTARANPSKIAIGVLFPGFDDNNAAWGTNRVIARQCGQTIGFTAAKIGSSGYSSVSQLQYAMISTLDDYEEGSETETGMDNCIEPGKPTISGVTISWPIFKSDATYASTNTISSWSIYTGTGAPTTLYASGISAAATSYSPAPVLTAGQHAWVYMVGQPLIQNRMSPASP
jgi:hypothetical protein